LEVSETNYLSSQIRIFRSVKMNRKLDFIKFIIHYYKIGAVFSAFMACLILTNSSCDIISNRAKKDEKRPTAVDHSTSKYFPPIGKQQIGDCTCWSSAYYYNTYTQARDEELDASTGDPDVVCSPRFLFSLISMGVGGAECTEHAMERLAEVGCAPVSKYSMATHWSKWPGEEARIAALKNRPGSLHKIRADNEEGLETIKQHIANGGCAVTRGLFRANYPAYGDSAKGPGIDNGVMYAKVGENWLRHSLCICGYNDTLSYVDARDRKTYQGAFLIANSEGPNWGSHNSTSRGTKGYLWIAYAMFLNGEFGMYDNDDNPYTDPCYDNPPYPMVYFHDDRPHYRPKLYAVVGINHNKRNLLTLIGGIGSIDSPEFIGSKGIEQTDKGEISIADTNRIVIDLTDGAHLFVPGKTQQVFVQLIVNQKADLDATITSADFYYDFDGKGSYKESSSADPIVTVAPGETGYAKVDLLIP
jgi:hypothetical protein